MLDPDALGSGFPAALDFRILKRAISVEQVLADKGLLAGLRRRGPYWVGPCPLHGGDNPNAFVVHHERNLWHCFTGCAAGGDVVELVRRLLGGTYGEVARDLARIAGTGAPPPMSPTLTPPIARPFRPFTRRLPLDPHAPLLRRKGIRPQTATRCEVGAYHGGGMLAGCIAVRLHDHEGHPLGYAGRRLDPQQVARRGKWVFPPGLPRGMLLYGYHRTAGRRNCHVVIVECPWGVLRLAQLDVPAVALLGTHLCEPQRALLADRPRIVLLLDGDHAGRKAATVIRRQLAGATVVQLPNNHDPDDLTDAALMRLLAPSL